LLEEYLPSPVRVLWPQVAWLCCPLENSLRRSERLPPRAPHCPALCWLRDWELGWRSPDHRQAKFRSRAAWTQVWLPVQTLPAQRSEHPRSTRAQC